MSTQDRHGLALSASSPDTARAFNHTVSGYLTCRADAPARLKELLAADPDYGLAHVLSGYFPMLGFNAATVPAARAAAETAQRLTMGATAHERPNRGPLPVGRGRPRRHARRLCRRLVDGPLRCSPALPI